MKKIIILFIIVLFLTTPLVTGRPSYTFSEEVFGDLPPFPEDFYDIKGLFATQTITAKQLPEQYYQPELLPNWEYWSEKTYANGSISFGNYGVFIYPSRFDIYNVKNFTHFNISALVYTNFGIRKYQGVQIYVDHCNTTEVTIRTPTEFILKPTAPHFHKGWMQLIEIDVYVKDITSDLRIEIRDRRPSTEKENEWKNTYGSDYTSGSSFLGQMTPKLILNLYQVPPPEETPLDKQDAGLPYTMIVLGFSIFLFVMFIIVLLKIKEFYDDKREYQEENR